MVKKLYCEISMRLFFYFILLIPSLGLAQVNQSFIVATPENIGQFFSQACPNQTPEYEVNFTQKPITQNFNLSSSQIVRIRDNQGNVQQQAIDERTLGLFTDKFEVSTFALYNYAAVANQSCKSVRRVIINITFTPNLYVAREAQGFSCTFKRVQEHEMKHFAISTQAFENLKQNISSLIRPYYDTLPIVYNNAQDYQRVFYERSNLVNQTLENYLNTLKLPGNSQLDNRANYLQEEKLCSPEENRTLKRMLF